MRKFADELELIELVGRVKCKRYTQNSIGFVQFHCLVEDDSCGCLRDEDGNRVEDWGLVESLMVTRALKSVSVSAEEAIGSVAEYFGRAAMSEFDKELGPTFR